MSAPEQHLARLRALVAHQLRGTVDPSTVARLRALCRVGVEVLDAAGVEVALVGQGGVTGVIAAAHRPASGPDGTREGARDPVHDAAPDPAPDPAPGAADEHEGGEDLQLDLGEGPAVLAVATGRPVAVPHLDDAAVARWPGWAPLAAAGGVAAAFAFPLVVGGARLGVVDVARSAPGELTEEQTAAALALTELAVEALLAGQRLAGPDRAPPDVDDALEHHTAVHQAQGMVAVQLGVDLSAALARLRARSFAEGRSLVGVAKDVVARKVVFEPDVPEDDLHDRRHR